MADRLTKPKRTTANCIAWATATPARHSPKPSKNPPCFAVRSTSGDDGGAAAAIRARKGGEMPVTKT